MAGGIVRRRIGKVGMGVKPTRSQRNAEKNGETASTAGERAELHRPPRVVTMRECIEKIP
jgi:hypothetical protein